MDLALEDGYKQLDIRARDWLTNRAERSARMKTNKRSSEVSSVDTGILDDEEHSTIQKKKKIDNRQRR